MNRYSRELFIFFLAAGLLALKGASRRPSAGPPVRPGYTKSAASRIRPLAGGLVLACAAGCLGEAPRAGFTLGTVDLVFGEKGEAPGRFVRPRAVTIDARDHLYIVDRTARIQVFSPDGVYSHGWSTPASELGRPCGMGLGIDGNILVADTHYHRVLTYTPEGVLLADRTIGGRAGPGPGEFSWVTDVVQDRQGNYYVSETREQDRISKFSPQRTFLRTWGSTGSEPGQFLRPQCLVLDEWDQLWVADACNHRIQVFDGEGRLVTVWGRPGSGPGELYYPYDLVLDDKRHVYVCEFGNERVQKFTRDGEFLGMWGTRGRHVGQLNSPWGMIGDRQGRLYVMDTENHRVQRVRFAAEGP